MDNPRETLDRLLYLRRELDRLHRELSDPARGQDLLATPVDVFEDEREIVLEVELPGIGREHIELSVLEDILVIEGEKREPPPGGGDYVALERSFGRFRRVIEIPRAGDTSAVRATYRDGVLRIALPKVQERRGRVRRVEIS